jgi:hypothetical protein
MSVIEVYDSLLDVPLDDTDEPDGDDSSVPGEEGALYVPEPVAVRFKIDVPIARSIAVRFIPVKRGDRGPAVFAVKRAALDALGDDRGWKSLAASTPGSKRWAGPFFPGLMVRVQKHFHLPSTGRYDHATHLKLAAHYDRFGLALLEAAAKPVLTKEQKLRIAFLAELTWLYNHRWGIVYRQNRPFDTGKPPWALDCSSSGEWAAKWAGLGSLSGYPSFGYGNTDSQLARYRERGMLRSGLLAAIAGDPIYYGRGWDPSHVGFYLGYTKTAGHRSWHFGSFPIKIRPPDYRHDRIAITDLVNAA